MRGVFYLQSFYSLLQSLNSLDTLVLQAKENDYDFVALSDDNNLYGMPTFLSLCQKHQIKAIVGMKMNFQWHNQVAELLVFAKNDKGINNLIQLSSLAKLKSPNYLDLTNMTDLGEGLFIIITGLCPFFENIFKNEQKDSFSAVLKSLKSIFSDIYLGISFQSFFLEMLVDNILDFANSFQLLCLPVRKTNYKNPQEQITYQVLSQMNNKKIEPDIDLSFLTKTDFDNKYCDFALIVTTLKTLISQIHYQTPLPNHFSLPSYLDFRSPQNQTSQLPLNSAKKCSLSSKKYLKQLAYQGLQTFLKPSDLKYSQYQIRLDKELKIISEMNYEDYFLIVSDVVKYAKKSKILVGPGRGSAAGSLVCFCLEITEINPLEYNLLFERFLNPQRKTLPDIDLDFPDNKRDIVIEYVYQKYGQACVASIITFGRFVSKKAIIREIVKYYPVKPFQLQLVLSFLDGKNRDKLDEFRPQEGTSMQKQEMKQLLHMTFQMEGLPRFTGTHAAGIILSSLVLSQHIPLQKGSYHNLIQTQWESSDLEAIGLLKIDFLGLRSLTLIDQMTTEINQNHPNFCLFDIPLDDRKTFQLLQQGHNLALFQLESHQAKNFLKKMLPKTFEDLISLLALNRPGTMDSFNLFLQNKRLMIKHFFDPLIDNILQSTYGVILYQEQIIEIVAVFANYTLAQADLFRRAISKKNKDLLLQEKNHFLAKSAQAGRNLFLASRLYDYILKFANYGFNKSHSAAYALISYRMAYLKANHFLIFMMTLLNDALNDTIQTSNLLKEVIKSGINLIKPHIFTSLDKYYCKDNQLFLPLNMIKGVSQDFCHKLIKERQKKDFISFKDFKTRLFFCLNEHIITNLIFAGSLDHMGFNRKTLFHHKDLTEVKHYQYLESYNPVVYPEFLSKQLILEEEKVFGFSLSALLNTKKQN